MGLPLALYASAGAMLIGLFAGWTVRDWKADSDALVAVEKGERQETRMEQIVDAASARFEQFREAEAPASVERRDTIREIYRNVEVPVECAAPPAIVGMLTDSRDRANAAAAGQLEAAVSPAAPDPATTVGP